MGCGARRSASSSIVVARRWRLDWRPVVRKALSLYSPATGSAHERSLGELETFFAERLRNLLERRGHSYDEISAVLNVGRLGLRRRRGSRAKLSRRRAARSTSEVSSSRSSGSATSSEKKRRAPAIQPRFLRRAVQRARRAPSCGGLSAGKDGDPGVGYLAPLSRGDGDDRVDRSLPGPVFVEVLVNCSRGGPAKEPARAAGLDPERILEPGGLLGDRGGGRRRPRIGSRSVEMSEVRPERGRGMR